MKQLKSIAIAVLFLTTPLLFNACADSSNKAESTEESTEQGKEFTSAYVCPMHCEGSGSEEPGKCPSCGMAYVEKHDHDGHSH